MTVIDLKVRAWIAGGFAVALAGCGPTESNTYDLPDEPLPVASDTVRLPGSVVPAVAWAGDRRWVVVDGDNTWIAFVDFASNKVVKVGRGPDSTLRNPY